MTLKYDAYPWLSQGITNMLAVELGYEDEDEFEDALKVRVQYARL